MHIKKRSLSQKEKLTQKDAGTVNSQTKGLYPLEEDAEVFYAILSTLCWDRYHFPKL